MVNRSCKLDHSILTISVPDNISLKNKTTILNIFHLPLASCRAADNSADLSKQTLNQLGDGHSTGNGVRVHDDVRYDSVDGPRHVLLAISHPNRTFLAVPRGKLIPDLGDAHVTDTHLHTDKIQHL